MLYFIVLFCLMIILKIYFKLANKYNIIDIPNERSSHENITIRGGGGIFLYLSQHLPAMRCGGTICESYI